MHNGDENLFFFFGMQSFSGESLAGSKIVSDACDFGEGLSAFYYYVRLTRDRLGLTLHSKCSTRLEFCFVSLFYSLGWIVCLKNVTFQLQY